MTIHEVYRIIFVMHATRKFIDLGLIEEETKLNMALVCRMCFVKCRLNSVHSAFQVRVLVHQAHVLLPCPFPHSFLTTEQGSDLENGVRVSVERFIDLQIGHTCYRRLGLPIYEFHSHDNYDDYDVHGDLSSDGAANRHAEPPLIMRESFSSYLVHCTRSRAHI